jgi:hypothetical protein
MRRFDSEDQRTPALWDPSQICLVSRLMPYNCTMESMAVPAIVFLFAACSSAESLKEQAVRLSIAASEFRL